MQTDWLWCYENPQQAAAEIDRLRLALRDIADTKSSSVDAIKEHADNALSPAPIPDKY